VKDNYCPHCAAGNQPVRREATGELCHNYVNEVILPDNTVMRLLGAFAHTLCWNDPSFKGDSNG